MSLFKKMLRAELQQNPSNKSKIIREKQYVICSLIFYSFQEAKKLSGWEG